MKNLKNTIFTLLFIIASINLNAQVGIGVPNPTAELDVDGKVKINYFEKVDPNGQLLYWEGNTGRVRHYPFPIEDLGYVYTTAVSVPINSTNPINTNNKSDWFYHGKSSTTIKNNNVNSLLQINTNFTLGGSYTLGTTTNITNASFDPDRGLNQIIGLKIVLRDVNTSVETTFRLKNIVYEEGPDYKGNSSYFTSNNFNIPAGEFEVEFWSIKLPWSPPDTINNSGYLLNLTDNEWKMGIQHSITNLNIEVLPTVKFYL